MFGAGLAGLWVLGGCELQFATGAGDELSDAVPAFCQASESDFAEAVDEHQDDGGEKSGEAGPDGIAEAVHHERDRGIVGVGSGFGVECRADGKDGAKDSGEGVGFDHVAGRIPCGVEAERVEVGAFFVEDANAFEAGLSFAGESWGIENIVDILDEGFDLSGE